MMGCSQQPSETETPLTKVTVSEVTHSVFYDPQYAAINLGFFEEEGIEIELSNGQVADKVMSAVLSGHCLLYTSKSWQAVAFAIGHYDEQYPRKLHNRYLNT